MSDASQFGEYDRWIGRKKAALRRPTLDCGHANAGEVFFHALCDRLSCSDECASNPHDCGEYAGVKSGSGEVSEPLEATPDVRVIGSVELHSYGPVLNAPHPAWTWQDITVGPSGAAESSRLDIRRRVQDGSAPIPAAHDHVAEALRAEVLRQGLTECEIDGVRWIYGGGRWSESPHQPAAESQVEALRSEVCGSLPALVLADASRIGPCRLPAGHPSWRQHIDEDGTSWRDPAAPPEPGAPLVDASSDTAPDEMPALRRAWWRRWTR